MPIIKSKVHKGANVIIRTSKWDNSEDVDVGGIHNSHTHSFSVFSKHGNRDFIVYMDFLTNNLDLFEEGFEVNMILIINKMHYKMIFEYIKKKYDKELNKINSIINDYIFNYKDEKIKHAYLSLSINSFLDHFTKKEPADDHLQQTINKLKSTPTNKIYNRDLYIDFIVEMVNVTHFYNTEHINILMEKLKSDILEYFDNIPHFEKQLELNKITT